MAEVNKEILARIEADGRKKNAFNDYEEEVVPPPDVIDNSVLYKVRVRFTAPVLGSKPMRRDLFERIFMPKNPDHDSDIEDLQMLTHGIYMANNLVSRRNVKLDESLIDADPEEFDENGEQRLKKPTSKEEEEEEAPLDSMVAGMTGFLCDEDGNPHMESYVPSGLMKYACRVRKYQEKKLSMAIKQYKHIITAHTSVTSFEPSRPNKLHLHIPKGRKADILSRPLHVSTKQGPRSALAISVVLPPETWFEFCIRVMAPKVITSDHLHEWLSYGQYQGFGQFRGGRYGTFDYTLSRLQKRA